jgi:hypothetical protein
MADAKEIGNLIPLLREEQLNLLKMYDALLQEVRKYRSEFEELRVAVEEVKNLAESLTAKE